MFMHNTFENNNENDIHVENSSYENAVKDFIHDEKQHLRNLNMIHKVFLDEINNVVPINEIEELQNMFQNLDDISDLTFTIIASFEDIIEMKEDKQPPLVGSCLEELAEDEEFEIYSRYTTDIIQTNGPDLIIDLLSENNKLDVLTSAGQGFREAVKYYLPKLLRYPIWHCFTYFDYAKIFQDLSTSETDKDNLEQLEGLLKPLQAEMTKLLSDLPKNETEYGVRLHSKQRHTNLIEKVEEMKKVVDGFEAKYIKQYCTELLREDTLIVQSGSKRAAQRRVTLFDGMLVLSKRKRSSSASGQAAANGALVEYKLKDVILTRKVEIKDRDDSEEIKNSFEIIPRDQLSFTFIVNSYEEKCLWMSDLIMLNIRCMLDRSLNSVLDDIERKNPLKMPPIEIYRFAEPDSSMNIVFEGATIKGATLLKLVERLTYHINTDAIFDRTFLITYRTFVTAEELLDLLIERYHVPEALLAFSIENTNSLTSKKKEDIKRYRKQYYQPIRFRVLNVLKRWVDCYFYDFESNEPLLMKLDEFLNSITEKSMKKWAVCIKKILQRKKDPIELCREVTYAFDRAPPAIEWHINVPEDEWNILTLHPVEIARQLTLIEYDMYKAVRSSELVGAAWTKENREEMAPHVMKIMKSTTNFALWLEKIIVETENLEERVSIVTRLFEIMSVLLDLNNFNGVFSIFSALGSACVFRLKLTTTSCPARLLKVRNEVDELCRQHYRKYLEKLHSVDPPCVPFFGVFLTKLMHAEDGNTDFLNDRGTIINFSKRRLITEIISEIQLFQDQPYCLTVEPKIKKFLETKLLSNPFDGQSEADVLNYLYQKSLEIEPRNGKAPRFPRKWPDLNLKSPGIKLRNSSQSYKSCHTANQQKNTHPTTEDDLFGDFPLLSDVGSASTQSRKQLRFNCTLIPIPSTAPFSPSKDISVFTPIFFGPDLPSGNSENNQSVSFSNGLTEKKPPLPPRIRHPPRPISPFHDIPSPILPPKDASPPPLPPRRDSLHIRQNSLDNHRSMMFEPVTFPSSFSSSVLDGHLSNSVCADLSFNDKNRRFEFLSSYPCGGYFSNELDPGSDPELSPDSFSQNIPLLFQKQSDLMELGDIFSNQNFVEESNGLKSPSSFSSTNLFFSSSMPDWNINVKNGNLSPLPITHSLPTAPIIEKSQRPLPKSIVIKRVVPTMFQFNVNSTQHEIKTIDEVTD